MTNIEYKIGIVPKTSEIVEIYKSSGIKRPVSDRQRIAKMYANANLIISAWSQHKLVGISRSLTDFCYACYLSDLAVKLEYQNRGIGRELVERTKKEIGKETALILLSAPSAMEYYPKLGFEKLENGFIVHRQE